MPRYVSTYFSPNQGSIDVFVGFINRCHLHIDAAIYSITHPKVVDALIDAKNRGVQVRVITDITQASSRWSGDERLEEASIPLLRQGKSWRGSMHNKFIIGDGAAVGTGSFNWTKNADQHNSENFVIIRLQYVVRDFQREFKKMWKRSNSD